MVVPFLSLLPCIFPGAMTSFMIFMSNVDFHALLNGEVSGGKRRQKLYVRLWRTVLWGQDFIVVFCLERCYNDESRRKNIGI